MSLSPLLLRRLRLRTLALAGSCGSRNSFHTSAINPYPRITRDRNPNRGVSPMRRQTQKESLGAKKYGIPEPELDPEKHTEVEVDAEHGLWGFFRDKTALPTPEDDHRHGISPAGRGRGEKRMVLLNAETAGV